jgi:hypothetical protein
MGATAEGKFKVGDRVRVLRHRNYMGDEFSDYGIPPGTTITLKDRDETMDGVGFVMFAVEEMGDGFSWVIRSDDIEHVTTSPIRTVTRREIVPGVYGARGEVTVGKAGTSTMVKITIDSPMSKNHLREAAHLFNQIAEVLEEV